MTFSLKKLILLLTVLILFHGTYLIADDEKYITIKPFAHEVEKIKPHPKAYFGTMKNGFKYILLKNKKPEDRVLINLVVDTGSLNEQEHERGIAHFLEHMAFNGSENFPDNKLIDFFKKIGMSFGGDTNASTSFDKTIYKLNLPSEEHMEAGLLIISDYASKLQLNEHNIEDERGIILSEKRARDSISFRIMEKSFQFALPNSLLTERMPIGLVKTIKSVNRKDFVNYYNTWYRPEKMTLIVVGDINEKKWRKSIKKKFKKLEARAPAKKNAVLKSVEHKGNKVNYIFEKEAAETNVEISTVEVKIFEKRPYYVRMQDRLREAAAVTMVNQRLKEIANEINSPFTNAKLSLTNWMKQIKSGNISADCKPRNWDKALGRIEQELRRVLQYGFTKQEVSLFKKGYLSSLDRAVSGMKTSSSNFYLHKIISTLGQDSPFLDASQIRAMQRPIVEDITKEDALNALSVYWNYNHRLISVTGNIIIEEPNKNILQAYLKSNAEVISKIVEKKILMFPYEKAPKNSGKIKSTRTIKDLGIKRIVFENNVILNLKKTDFKKTNVRLFVKLGQGSLTVPKGKEVMARIGHSFINEGGLEKLTKLELGKALTGKTASINFGISPNAFHFVGSSNNDDFELMLQLLNAKMKAPGFREETRALILKRWDVQLKKLETNISAKFRNELRKLATITENGIHLDAMPTKHEIESISINDMKDWLTNEFKSSSIEINIVGDFNEKEVIGLVSTYLGGLPTRKVNQEPKKYSITFKKNHRITLAFPTKIEKAYVALVMPTTDFNNINDLRKLNLLGRAINERMRKRIREELSISYSPRATHSFNKDFKNNCHLMFMADIEVKNIDLTVKEFQKIFTEIISKPITKEELDGVQKPLLNQIKPYIKSNTYWLNSVLAGSSYNEKNFDFARTFMADYTNINVKDINDIAKKYLIKEKVNILVVRSE
ncbi:MAG: hypothetical protein COA79_19635 [Planctomycetota bacterium]|nr:MAG: hypothetical protein COA79_19635 [Planctomycetota bacterium]